MTDTEKAKAYDDAVAYAKRVLDCLAEDYRCTHMTKDDIINQYSRLFPHEEAFQDDEDSFACRKLIYGLKSLLQQGKETFAGADITDLIDYLEKKKERKPIDIDFVSVWLRKHIKSYVNSEYNEFHKTVEYDGSINIEHLIEDLKKATKQQPVAHENDFVSKPAECGKDERIRKELIEFLREAYSKGNAPEECAKWIVWLDQPKEQKPAEWSEEDKQWLSEVYFAIDHSMYSENERQAMKKYIDSLRSQSKAAEWSEEEKGILLECVSALQNSSHWVLADKLLSLHPKSHWKPSEEQIKALKIARNFVVDDFGENPTLSEILKALQEQLEKLM